MQSTQITVFHGAYILRWSNTGILSGTSVTTVNVSTQKNYNKTRHKTPSVTTVIASTQKILTITTKLTTKLSILLHTMHCMAFLFVSII